ncbi:hypothetical protein HDV01_000387 [Terramyces sp. JEL0728]|nr:hypothetical protein HDV01_000387 [Terramyces sp. JEL0728]
MRFVTSACEHRLEEIEWLSDESKQNAKIRLSKFTRGIGHFEDKDLAVLEGKVLQTKSPWENYKVIAKFLNFPINFYHKSVNRTNGAVLSRIIRNATRNGMIYPVYIAQPPFFYPATPDKMLGEPALNFGSLGVLFAQELIYSLDVRSTKYDQDGNIITWLDDKDCPYYAKQVELVIQQFDEYNYMGEGVNGKLTSAMNISDLCAISLAFQAFQEFKREYGDKVKPSTYLFTPEQEFFISWAQVCRSLVTDEQAGVDRATSHYSPRELRVNGPLSNLREFYEAFNVKPGDRMYRPPDKRVSLCVSDRFLYQYVNGGWLNKSKIPKDHSIWGSFEELHDKPKTENEGYLLNFFELHPTDAVLKEYFLSALDEEAIEKAQLDPTKEDLAVIASIETLEDYFIKAAAFNAQSINTLMFYLYKFTNWQFYGDSELATAILLQDGLGLPSRDYYLQEEKQEKAKAYKEYIKRLLIASGESLDEAMHNVGLVYQLEYQLAEISLPLEELCDPAKNNTKKSLEELQSAFPLIDWKGYFAKMEIPDSVHVIIEPVEYFERLLELLQKTDLATLKIYMKVRYLSTAAPFLHKEMQLIHFEYQDKALYGVQEMEPKWKRAFQLVCDISDLISQYDVLTRSTTSITFNNIFTYINTAFEHRLESIKWLSKESKQNAVKMLSQVQKGVGHFEKKAFTKLEGKVLKTNSLWDNHKLAAKYLNHANNFYHKSVDRTRISAIMKIIRNSTPFKICFPTFYEQPPFHYLNPPSKLLGDPAFTFGGFGMIYARELLYALDLQNAKYDRKGDISDWLTEDDKEYYYEQTGRIIDQFEQYNSQGKANNAKFGAGHNIADLGALSIAFQAFQDFKKEYGDKVKPSTYLYSTDQEFFIAWAQLCRVLVTNEQAELDASTSCFAPRELRVDGPLSNLNEFYEAFNVKPGDSMYRPPEKRVSLWWSLSKHSKRTGRSFGSNRVQLGRFTPEQEFFVARAQAWRRLITKDEAL